MKHRFFKPALFSLLLLFITGIMMISGCSAGTAPVTRTGFYFDTVISLTCYGYDSQDILEEAFALCDYYEKTLSRTVKNSDIWNINHAAGSPVKVHEETASLLQKALEYSRMTGGLIDPTVTPLSELWNFTGDPRGPVPEKARIEELLTHIGYQTIRIDGTSVQLTDPDAEVDLGFIAKGFIADRLKDFFLEKGMESALINLGGNVLAVGSKPDGSAFRTGIQKPFGKTGEALQVIELRDRSLVSSGSYERCFEQDGVLYHHILDPSDGYPADTGLSGVTVLSYSSLEGDALSTACFLLGLQKGTELINSMPDTEALFVMADGSIHKTDGFPD